MNDLELVRVWKDPRPSDEVDVHPAGWVDLSAMFGGRQAPVSEDLGTSGCCSVRTWCGTC